MDCGFVETSAKARLIVETDYLNLISLFFCLPLSSSSPCFSPSPSLFLSLYLYLIWISLYFGCVELSARALGCFFRDWKWCALFGGCSLSYFLLFIDCESVFGLHSMAVLKADKAPVYSTASPSHRHPMDPTKHVPTSTLSFFASLTSHHLAWKWYFFFARWFHTLLLYA